MNLHSPLSYKFNIYTTPAAYVCVTTASGKQCSLSCLLLYVILTLKVQPESFALLTLAGDESE